MFDVYLSNRGLPAFTEITAGRLRISRIEKFSFILLILLLFSLSDFGAEQD